MVFVNYPEVHVKIEGMENVKIPRMMKVRQIYDSSNIEDVSAQTKKTLEEKIGNKERFRGKRICITAGSRGVPHIDEITKAIVDTLKDWGADPFLIPAMGSHGGATAEGQKEYLAGYNITEETMGCPILSSMEVVQIGALQDGTPVYCDKYAYHSDGIVILNKVKPHTDFRGPHESGLAKMMAIGIAKHVGAAAFHKLGFASFGEKIPQVADVFLANAPVVFGVGLVQNAYDDICAIEACEKEDIMELDARLLEYARKQMPTFKMHDIDVLIIDEIGKNISGNGHDPNITGRGNSPGFEDVLNLKKMVILGLTEETHHNGCGIACADLTTRRCLNSLDLESFWINVYNVNLLHGGRIPVYTNTDYEAIRNAIRTCLGIKYEDVKIVHIKNTLRMTEIEVSENFREFAEGRDDMEILSEPYELSFDEEGFLNSVFKE